MRNNSNNTVIPARSWATPGSACVWREIPAQPMLTGMAVLLIGLRRMIVVASLIFATTSHAATLPVTIHTVHGPKHLTLEIAATEPARQQGLMHRKTLAPSDGMIFLFPAPAPQSFWMKNTPLPLDILYVNPAGRIVSIARGEPFSTAPLPSDGPVNSVIELDAGRAKRDAISIGDEVDYALPPSVTIR